MTDNRIQDDADFFGESFVPNQSIQMPARMCGQWRRCYGSNMSTSLIQYDDMHTTVNSGE